MSRIQNILDKAEREGATLRTSRIGAPVSPIAAGLVLGGAFAFGREYLDRSVHDARGLRDEFELPVLAEIPRIEAVLG